MKLPPQLQPLLQINRVTALQWYSLIRFAMTLLIGIALAKGGYPASEIAIYETLLFLGNLVSFFWIGGGQNALLSYHATLQEEQRKRLFFNVFILFLALGVFFAGGLYLGREVILQRFTNFENIPYLGWMVLFLIFNIPTNLVHLFYLLRGFYKNIVWYSIIAYGGQLLWVLLVVFRSGSLELLFMGLAVVGCLKFLWTLRLVAQFSIFRIDSVLLRQYLVLAVPLTLHLLIGNSVEYVDGLIVTSYFAEEGTFAIFRYGARELPLAVLLIGALVKSAIPLIAEDPQNGLLTVKLESKRLMQWLFPLSALLMLSSPYLFRYVYTPEFAASAQVFNVYLLILSSRILLPQTLIIGLQKNYFLVISALVETFINIALSLWWVRIWGLEGIAIASVVAFAINKLNLIAFNYWRLGIHPREYIPLRVYGLHVLTLFFIYGLQRWWLGF